MSSRQPSPNWVRFFDFILTSSSPFPALADRQIGFVFSNRPVGRGPERKGCHPGSRPARFEKWLRFFESARRMRPGAQRLPLGQSPCAVRKMASFFRISPSDATRSAKAATRAAALRGSKTGFVLPNCPWAVSDPPAQNPCAMRPERKGCHSGSRLGRLNKTIPGCHSCSRLARFKQRPRA